MGTHSPGICFSVLLLFCSLSVVVESLRTEEEVNRLFEEWKLKQDKAYHGLAESKKRFEIFRTNLLFIDEHNRPENNHTYRLGLTCFADLTNEEYRSRYVPAPLNMSGMIPEDFADVPPPKKIHHQVDFLDWREKGVVTGVKNQGRCSSCWAFAAVATVESINAMVTGSLISLSEQEIVDCDDQGAHCRPGSTLEAYKYIVRNGGLDADSNYPYVKVQQECKIDRNRVVTIDGHRQLPRNNETQLKHYVDCQPIASAIHASSREFQLYKSGVFLGPCTTKVDHAVTIIGYGEEENEKYWLVKNSWGQRWGDEGILK